MAKNYPAGKTQRARSQTGRNEKEEKTPSIAGLDIRHVGTVVQSFAVFVAISTLLGRIYSLTYFETLGIPASEIRLSVTEYSVVSPEVTIFGVGFSIVIAIFLWSDGVGALEIFPRWARFLIGSGCCLVAVFIPIYAVIYSSMQPDLDSVWLTIQMLLALALVSFGGAIIGSGVSPDAQRSDQEIALGRAVMPLMVILVVGFAIWTASEFSSIMGEVNARITWAKAPQARIELASSDAHETLRYGPDECDTDSLRCHFRVILIGDKFVYLRPVNAGSPEERLYALPIGDIAGITYVFEGTGQ